MEGARAAGHGQRGGESLPSEEGTLWVLLSRRCLWCSVEGLALSWAGRRESWLTVFVCVRVWQYEFAYDQYAIRRTICQVRFLLSLFTPFTPHLPALDSILTGGEAPRASLMDWC